MPVSKNRKGQKKKSNQRKDRKKQEVAKLQKQFQELQRKAIEEQKQQAAIDSVGKGMKFN